ncbi:MAG: N-acetylglucosaminyl-diphospho-decaprenol L-rhamnosyltransferase [Cellvibrionaceae bacterium]|jgi:N-acetylglucosaminyl-diphospho-decaprenol L-rhamnosyltransferase
MYEEDVSTNKSLIAVIIVNYGTAKLVIAGIAALEKERRQLPRLHVVVVDNCSPDNSQKQIQSAIEASEWQPWVRLVTAEKNGGYAYGNNLGFSVARDWLNHIDYFWMLNPDTRVLPDATAHLVNFLESHPNTIAGSCLQDADGTKQVSTFNFPSVISELCSGFSLGFLDRWFKRFIVVRDIPTKLERSDWMAGASLMFSGDVQKQLGGLDEKYFLYYEEVDYLMKAQKSGVHCYYVPESRVIHEVGAATGISDTRKVQPRRPRYWFESRRRFLVKNYSYFHLVAADLLWMMGYSTWVMRKFVVNREELHRQPPRLLRDFFSHSFLNPKVWFESYNL